MSEILKFYRDQPNASGYTWSEVMGWDDERWEVTHDFIQWVFPTDEVSEFNHFAPMMTKDEAYCLSGELDELTGTQPVILVGERYLASIARAKAFLKIGKYEDDSKRAHWVSMWNHNVLRISRMIRSICLVRGWKAATIVREEALSVGQGFVSKDSIEYWVRNSGIGKPPPPPPPVKVVDKRVKMVGKAMAEMADGYGNCKAGRAAVFQKAVDEVCEGDDYEAVLEIVSRLLQEEEDRFNSGN